MQTDRMGELRRGALVGGFLRLLGHPYHSILLSEAGLTLSARQSKTIPLSALAGPARVTKTLGFSAITMPV